MPVKIGKPEPDFVPLETLAAPKVKNYDERWIRDANNNLIYVRYGVRWHPDDDARKVELRAFMRLNYGDSIGWHGESVLKLPDTSDLAPFAVRHGGSTNEQFANDIMELDIDYPTAPEALEDFKLPWHK